MIHAVAPEPRQDTATAARPPRAFISYSHDSPEHRARVLALALELRAGGVDCELDQFHEDEPPPEGWPAWMRRQIHESDYVILVCTQAYYRRATGGEADGVGLGARWEAQLITQALYDAGGKNAKFIPAVFGTDDLSYRPEFVRATTYYDVADAVRRQELYWRVTRQPGLVKPPLGVLQVRPETAVAAGANAETTGVSTTPGHPAQPLALLVDASDRRAFLPLVSAEETQGETILVVHPDTGEARAFLDALRGNRFGASRVTVAYRTTAYRARLTAVVRTLAGGDDRYTLTLAPEQDAGQGMSEISTTGLSADRIADLRARRILLDEMLPPPPNAYRAESMLESLVCGMNTGWRVERSPLPDGYKAIGAQDPPRLLAALELVAVLWLRLSGTVAHVLELDMRLIGASRLSVRFRGQRGQQATNRPPATITVEGECALT